VGPSRRRRCRVLAAGPGVPWMHADWPLAAVAALREDATSAKGHWVSPLRYVIAVIAHGCSVKKL